MLYGAISSVLSRYFFCFAIILLVPLGVSILYEFFLEPHMCPLTSATMAFFETIVISCLLAWGFWLFGRKAKEESLRRKECILLVVSIWFLSAGLGALPFLLSSALDNPIDAYFEAMSSLTTTGATIIEPKSFDSATGLERFSVVNNPLQPQTQYTFHGTVNPLRDCSGKILAEGFEALGKPLLFWRSFFSWLGGIGVVVLFIAVLPALALGGKFLYETEVAGPSKEGMTPRIKETASFLWKLYIALTLLLILCIILTDSSVPLFDVVTLAFGTISTGGFYPHDVCLINTINPLTGVVIIIFMIVGGVNFSLFFQSLRRRSCRFNDPEFYLYLISLVVAGCLLFGILSSKGYPWIDSIYFGAFQAVSAMTSTGYSLVDYDGWPMPAQLLIIILMFIGGMSGSTAGGIKLIRYLIVWRVVFNKIEMFFRPELVRVMKVGSREITDKESASVLTFFFFVFFFVVIGTYLFVLDGIDPLTALGIVSSTINNNGLYFGGIGCTSSLAFLSNASKLMASFWMVLGRLEFLSLLVLLSPHFWSRR